MTFIEEKDIHIGSRTLTTYCYNGNATEPLYVFLHGIFANFQFCFQYQIDHIRKNNASILGIDLFGHGKSDHPQGVTLNEMGDAIKTAISEVHQEGQPVIFVAHSLGTFIAQRLAYELQNTYYIPHIILGAGFFYTLDTISRSIFKASMKVGGTIPEKVFTAFINTPFYQTIHRLSNTTFTPNAPKFDEFNEEAPLLRHEQIRTLSQIFSEDVNEIDPDAISYKIISIRGTKDVTARGDQFNKIAQFYGAPCFSIQFNNAGHVIFFEKYREINALFDYFWNLNQHSM
jgi:pimeloyl-ACP methyl ester carboxylesterase